MDGGRISIPIKVARTTDNQSTVPQAQVRAAQPGSDRPREDREMVQPESSGERPVEVSEAQESVREPESATREEPYWRERALRLQAEMENYRKRQQRLAQDEIEGERQRLLRAFLQVVDDLERALRSTASEAVTAPANKDRALRQGIELTYRTASQLLQTEGVERFAPEGQPFDPNWHEAVATVGHDGGKARPQTIVQVVEPGYRLGDRLLRPARVVVAV
jgi:molecular chaperone GrpE